MAIGFLLYERNGLLAIFSIIAAYFIAVIVQFIVHRPRPLPTRAISSSFPSGHATISSATFAATAIINPVAGVLIGILAVLISIGRVKIGVHYATDVLAGWIIGFGVAIIFFYVS